MSNRALSATRSRPLSSTSGAQKPTLSKILSQASTASSSDSQRVSSKQPSTQSMSSSSSSRSASGPRRPIAFGSTYSTSRSSGSGVTTGAKTGETRSISHNSNQSSVKKSLTSTRLNPHKTSNPFSSKNKYRTNFGIVYDSGEIPCRIYHTGNKMLIQWDQHPDELSYNPLILNFAEGLRESQHPYVFIARQGLKELLGSGGAKHKLLADQFLINQLSNAIRLALMSQEAESDIFEAGLGATEDLCICLEGEILIPVLDKLLVPVSRKSFDKKYSQKISKILQSIDQACGSNEEVTKLIRKKVPSYLR